MKIITIESIISFFAIASLDHEDYTGVNSRYLAGEAALANCDLVQLSGILFSKETRQCTMGIPSALPSTTTANHVSNTPTKPPPYGFPNPQPPQPPTQSSNVAYPPQRGAPCKCIAVMMREDKVCPVCHLTTLRNLRDSNSTKS